MRLISGGWLERFFRAKGMFDSGRIIWSCSLLKGGGVLIQGLALLIALFMSERALAQNVSAYKQQSTFLTDYFKNKISNDNVFDNMLISLDQAEKMKAEAKQEEARLKAIQEQNNHAQQQQNRSKALGRVSSDAPDEFKEMMISYRLGDTKAAEYYADAFVDYMMNLMFEVKQITNLIGKALVKKGAVKEDDIVGVGQYAEVAFAEGREANFSVLKPTHEEAMKRIKADPNGQAEIYYFFTLSCTYCREMAADIERLWQVAKGDPNLRMVALSLVPMSKGNLKSYRDYTGMTLPIMEGGKVAKSFNVALVPAVVVVSPNQKVAYIKSGEQNFARLYEFVRTVQGLPSEMPPEVAKLMQTPIGKEEQKKLVAGEFYVQDAKKGKLGIKKINGVSTKERNKNLISERF